MAKSIKPSEVKARMAELLTAKQAQLDEIANRQRDVQEKLQSAKNLASRATEDLDFETFAEAEEDRKKFQTALRMLSDRYKQLEALKYIPEEESDEIIDGLLQYEEELAPKFKESTAQYVEELEKQLKQYKDKVKDVEDTIREWTNRIHPNYKTRGRMTRIDEATGETTDRAEHPVPVHVVPYLGCSESTILDTYLNKVLPLYKERE